MYASGDPQKQNHKPNKPRSHEPKCEKNKPEDATSSRGILLPFFCRCPGPLFPKVKPWTLRPKTKSLNLNPKTTADDRNPALL